MQPGVKFGLTFDVHQAHRQIPIREEDWGYLACRAQEGAVEDLGESDIIYVNKVGTFGVGSAAYRWARLMAVVARIWLGIAASEWLVYLLTYVDDLWATAVGPGFEGNLLAVLVLLRALRVPLSARYWIGLAIGST